MIFDYESVITDLYKKKNNLEIVNINSKKFKEYKKNKLENRFSYVRKFTKDSIRDGYVESMCQDNNNKILSYCIDTQINSYNIPTIIIHRKLFKAKRKIRYAILLIITKKEFRNYGYGNSAFFEYINYINFKKRKLEIVLHSLKKAEKFYLDLGFHRIQQNLFLERLEGLNNNEEDTILLKYVIKD